MATLVESAKDSEKTFKESLISSLPNIIPLIEKYNSKDYECVKAASFFHENPILRDTKGNTSNNNNTFESKGGYYLKKKEIQEFYDNGFISQKYKFIKFSNQEIENVQKEYLQHIHKLKNGSYDSVYGKLPDYVVHLYIPSVVKLLNDNYDFIVQKAASIFNKPEEELFFSVGIFVVDNTEKGTHIHQDYSYYFLDQLVSDIKTSLITFHTSINHNGNNRLYLFPGTHKEILHNLPTLKYLEDHNIPIDASLAKYTKMLSEYILDSRMLPYDDLEGNVSLFSHFSRYPQLLYIINKYRDKDIKGFRVDTQPGEFTLFDPAVLHSTGVSSGNLNELLKNFEGEVNSNDISRLSLAIRVMHTKNDNDHLLWMAAQEKMEVMQNFLNVKLLENGLKNSTSNIRIDKTKPKFYTVLSNNKLSSRNSPYFSVRELYDLHALSGAYTADVPEK